MTDIKVGSEWVDRSSGEKAKVDYVGCAFIILTIDGVFERGMHLSSFITEYKPAPVRRTVWLNVYSNYAQCYKDKEEADRCRDLSYLLYQQEVELIDPREGEKG